MVGCRVEPDLKELLDKEATQTDKTLSAYIETILKQRHHSDDDVQKLKERIFELETNAAALQSRLEAVFENDNVKENTAELEKKLLAQDVEIRTLKQQKMDITGFYKRAIAERDTLAKLQRSVVPHWMSTNSYNMMINYVRELQKLKPKLTHEQVLVVALATALRNEKSGFTMFRMADFLNKNSNFFTQKMAQKS